MIRVGQKLQEERIRKKLSLDDVSAATKIKISFLSAIEKGEYHKLPSPAYAHGFVVNYAEFLGLPKKETAALFRREYASEKEVNVLPESMVEQKRMQLRGFRVQRRFILLFTLCIIVLGYIAFQYRFMFLNPSLTVTEPKENQMVTSTITVLGKTDPNAVVVVNGEEVAIGKDGRFVKKITAFPGENTILIKAKNRLGRESVVERTVRVWE